MHSIRVLSRASTDREGASSALMVDRHQTINLGAPGDGGRFLCTLCRCVVRKKWQTHLAQHCRTLERELKKKTGLDGGGPGDTIAIPAGLKAACRDLLEQAGGGGEDEDDSDPDAEAVACAALALDFAQTERLLCDLPRELRDREAIRMVVLQAARLRKLKEVEKAEAEARYRYRPEDMKRREEAGKRAEDMKRREEAGKRAGVANAGPKGARKRPRVEEPARAAEIAAARRGAGARG